MSLQRHQTTVVFSSHLNFFFSKQLLRIYFPFIYVLGRRERQNYIFKRSFFVINDQGDRNKPLLIQKVKTNSIFVASVSAFSHEINGDNPLR